MFGTPYRECGLCISQFISEEGDEVTKSRETELVRMTQQCWQHYWQLDMNFMLSYCDESVTWIGAEQSEFIRGLEELKQNLRVALARGCCNNVTREEVHSLIDEILDEYGQ